MKHLFFYNSDPANSGSNASKTDNTKLVTGPTVYVSPDGGTTDEPFPKPNVEYDFCIDVTNTGNLPSGPFFVRFVLDNGTGGSGNQNFDFQQDAGLDPNQSVKAVVHFGQFANDDDTEYTLSACIYSPSAPQTPINCAGTFGFNPHLNSSSSSSGDSGNTGGGANDSSSGSSGSDDTSSDSSDSSGSGSDDSSSGSSDSSDSSSGSSDDSGSSSDN